MQMGPFCPPCPKKQEDSARQMVDGSKSFVKNCEKSNPYSEEEEIYVS